MGQIWLLKLFWPTQLSIRHLMRLTLTGLRHYFLSSCELDLGRSSQNHPKI